MNSLTKKNLIESCPFQIGWQTDPHWEFVTKNINKLIKQECEYINSQFDLFVLTGDISTHDEVDINLDIYDKNLTIPMWFVLGNHDYYGNYIRILQKSCEEKTRYEWENVLYAPTIDGKLLQHSHTFLVFVNGFGDGIGNYTRSLVNDENYIFDFKEKPNFIQKTLRQEFALDSVKEFNKQINSVMLKNLKQIIIFTHVPPFKEACFYNGKPSNLEYLPFFCNRPLGDRIYQFAEQNSGIKIRVYCGHTHNQAYYKFKNIECWVGKAEYGSQFIERITL